MTAQQTKSQPGYAGRPGSGPGAREVLRLYWGHSTFRSRQEEIIESVALGTDTLALLPTGGGKSICYQIPGILRGGITLVISPLVSLMHDQVGALAGKGIKAFAMTGRVSPRIFAGVISRVEASEAFFVYLAPERLGSRQLKRLVQTGLVRLIAVDEAHCISSWGHDFRPEYRKIAALRAVLPGVPVCAVTATARTRTIRDIVKNLRLQDPRIVRTSFDRPNISFRVHPVIDARSTVLRILEMNRGAAIVYDSTREGVEIWAEKLRRAHVSATAYHGGMSETGRIASQRSWMRKKSRVMVATNAFGMGIDRPDVRTVIHVGMPDSIESYYQEAGRAGRDGRPAEVHLLVSPDSIRARKALVKGRGSAAWIPDFRKRHRARRNLAHLLRYAERPMCRRWGLLGYFGEHAPSACKNCDVCCPDL